MNLRGGKAWAFALTLLLVWQTGAFSCHGQSEAEMPGTEVRSTADKEDVSSGGDAGKNGRIRGEKLAAGDRILLGADEAGNGGYLFALLDTQADGITGAGLLFYTDPLGLEQTMQQFDEAAEEHPDEDSRAEGCSLWRESDLYIALNGQAQNGSTDTHGADVAAAERFFQAISAAEAEWSALLPGENEALENEAGGAAALGEETVSLLSETEYERYRDMEDRTFWYTEDSGTGFWLKTARAGYSWQVRYIYSDDIEPSLSSKPYYASAREKRSVRPALRLNLEAVTFGAGSGTETDPYRELALRPVVEGAELSGLARVGEKLTLTVSPAGADCTYRWYRDGVLLTEETGSGYQLGEDDAGSVIRGEAQGTGEYYGRAEALTAPVDKGVQKPPEGEEIPGPEELRITDNTLRVLATEPGLEYAVTTAAAIPAATAAAPGAECVSDSALAFAGETALQELEWNSTGAFSGLSAETDYELYVRRAEKKAWYASPPAAPVAVRTKAEGETVTLTVEVRGWNPQEPAAVLLEPLLPEIGGEALDTLTGAGITGTGSGVSVQIVTISGVEMDTTYRATVSKAGHLSITIWELSITEDGSLKLTLPCGDGNGDGSIDWKDRQLLLSACMLGKGPGPAGESGTEPSYDLDGDGCVGLRDLYILMQAGNYGKRVGAL